MSPIRSPRAARPGGPWWLLPLACSALACTMSPEDPSAYAADDCQDTVAYARPLPTASVVAAPPSAGYMTIVCAPHCEIFEGGAFVGPSPIVDMAAAPGEHRFEVRGPGGVQRTIVVRVEPGKVTRKRVVLFGPRAHAWRRHERPPVRSREE